jgi:hypothetical protein
MWKENNMSLLAERARRGTLFVYKHVAPPERRQVSEIHRRITVEV